MNLWSCANKMVKKQKWAIHCPRCKTTFDCLEQIEAWKEQFIKILEEAVKEFKDSPPKKDVDEVQDVSISGDTKMKQGKKINTEHMPVNSNNQADKDDYEPFECWNRRKR